MRRPDAPAMDQLEAILRDIRETEDALQQLKSKLREMPSKIAGQIDDEESRVEAARYLYWIVQELPSMEIAKAFFNTHDRGLKQIIGPAKGAIPCDRCKQPIQFKNRTHLKESIDAVRKWTAEGLVKYPEGYTVLCEPCWHEVHAIRNEKYELYSSIRSARLNELKIMTYSKYLQTPEWQERRLHHLKSADYRCQVCNSSNQPIDVHHRTYERRGEEQFKDLIALCRSCHELFHKQSKLAED
jgi:hypothetical protein